MGAKFFQQFLARHHGAASGNQVVNQEHAVARFDGVGVQLHGGAAVFQFVGFFYRGKGQLAFFADGHKAHVELIGHHRTQNETTGVQSGHYIGTHVGVHVAVHKGVNQHPKDLGILQQRRDVAELHARRRPVGHGANVGFEVLGDG